MSGIANFAAHAPLLMTMTPVWGAALCWLIAHRGDSAARLTAIVNASLTVILTAVVVWNFSPDAVGPQMTSSLLWQQWPLSVSLPESAIHVRLAFGVDGVSLVPLIIVALTGWMAVVMADRTVPSGEEPPYAGLLLGQAFSLSLFAVQDFAAWIFCGELWAWWAFFLIGRHGGEGRRHAARRVLLTMSLAQLCWMLAGIGMAVCLAWIHADVRGQPAGVSLLYSDLTGSLVRWIAGNLTALQLWTAFGPWVLLLWGAGLWLLWPIFPAHGGLLRLLTEARAPLAALCGTSLILQGGYVWFRFAAPLLSAGGSVVFTVLSTCASCGVLYFGLLALRQHSWRTLGGMLTLSAMQTAWLCSASTSVVGSLTGWRMICALSLATTAIWLLIGWREHQGLSIDVDRLAHPAPRWLGLIALTGGLLASVPCFALMTGQTVLQLLELQRRGVPNLTLIAGSTLSAWSWIRALLHAGSSASSNGANGLAMSAASFDIRRRDWLLAMPMLLALICLVSPNLWEAWLGATWQRLHDPFSAPATSSLSTFSSITTSTAHKPTDAAVPAPADFPWLCAPVLWGLCGLLLWGTPRSLLTIPWARGIALVGLACGGLADWLSGAHCGAVIPYWATGGLVALVLISLVQLTVAAEAVYGSPARWGGLLLRISGISWSARTGDLLWAGLAWELAEFGRWSSYSRDARLAGTPSREQLRWFFSSLGFWLGLAVLASVMHATSIASLAAKLAELAPRTEDGQITGVASSWALTAAILLCSGIGMRCGLLPWSLGRWRDQDGRAEGGVLDQWLDHLLGLTMLVSLTLALGDGLGGPLAILLALAAAATAAWNGVSVIGEGKVTPVLHALASLQFAAMTLMAAGLMAKPAALSTGIGEQLDLSSIVPLMTQGIVLITGALCGAVVLLRHLGKPDFGELYFDHYRGLFSRRWLEATLLASLLICLAGRGMFAPFLPAWIALTNLVMTPLLRLHVPILPHPVLNSAAMICLLAGMPLLGRIADWISRLAFDQPIALPARSSNPWPLGLAGLLTAGVVIVTVCPGAIDALISACQ